MNQAALDTWMETSCGTSFATRDDLERYQLQKLNELLKREHAHGGFYRELPESLESLDGLEDLPFTTAEDVARFGKGVLLVSPAQVTRIVSQMTSGTTGNPKRVYYTSDDIEDAIGFFEVGLRELVQAGDKVLIAMPFSGPDGLGEIVSSSIARIGAQPLKVGVGVPYRTPLDVLEAERPKAYIGMPIPLLSLLRLAGACSIVNAVVSGDTLPNCAQDEIERRFGVALFPHYGSREMCFGGAITLGRHDGMHLRENHVIAEIVDSRGQRVPDGERGELAITTIGMRAFPLVRYRTGDAARLLPSNDGSGSVTKRLADVCRASAGLDIAALDEAMFKVEGLVDYRAHMEGDLLAIDAMTLDGRGADKLEEAARSFYPNASVSIARALIDSCMPAYNGKRAVLADAAEAQLDRGEVTL